MIFKMFRIVLPILLVVMLLIGATWIVYVNSAVKIVAHMISPDGKQEAMLLVINPGAADGYATALMIEPGNSTLWRQIARLDNRRVFVITNNGGAPAGEINGQLTVRLEWASNTDLTVDYPAKAEVIRREMQHGAVHINYRPK